MKPRSTLLVVAISLVGCVPPQQGYQQPYGYQQPQAYPQQAQPYQQPSAGYQQPQGQPAAPYPGARRLTFNGRAATQQDLQIMQQLELQFGQRVPDGDYWYDNVSGAAGRWGGPTATWLPAGLGLGGTLPPNASGGGTRVFVNGRELHPIDLQGLQQIVGAQIQPGRYWVDGQGNAGPEGGAAVINLVAASRQRGGGGGAWSKYYDAGTGRPGDNMGLASDGQTTCVNTAEYTRCTGDNN